MEGGTLTKVLATILIAAGMLNLTSIAAPAKPLSWSQKLKIIIFDDTFGTESWMTKDWGFSGWVEVAGKQIWFDIGAMTPISLQLM